MVVAPTALPAARRLRLRPLRTSIHQPAVELGQLFRSSLDVLDGCMSVGDHRFDQAGFGVHRREMQRRRVATAGGTTDSRQPQRPARQGLAPGLRVVLRLVVRQRQHELLVGLVLAALLARVVLGVKAMSCLMRRRSSTTGLVMLQPLRRKSSSMACQPWLASMPCIQSSHLSSRSISRLTLADLRSRRR
jgi:hypothetical protein